MRVRAALALGVAGYVLKHDSRAELMLAIRSVMQGKAKTYLSPTISQFLVSAYLGQLISDMERLRFRSAHTSRAVALMTARRELRML